MVIGFCLVIVHFIQKNHDKDKWVCINLHKIGSFTHVTSGSKKADGYGRRIGQNGSAVLTRSTHCVARQCSDKSTLCCHFTCDTRYVGVDSYILDDNVFNTFVLYGFSLNNTSVLVFYKIGISCKIMPCQFLRFSFCDIFHLIWKRFMEGPLLAAVIVI